MKLLTTALLTTSLMIQSTARQASFVPSYRLNHGVITKPIKKINDTKKTNNQSIISQHHPLSIRGGDTSLNSTPNLVTTLVPKIGVLTSTLLYFSPLTAVKRAQTNNDVESLNPIPLTIMAISSLSWLVYGLSIQDPYVTLSNVPGCIASIWYVVSILPLLKEKMLTQTQGMVVILSALTINLWTWLSLTKKTMGQISTVLGMYASFLFILLSGSPLSTIKTVVMSKNSKTILIQLTLAQVVNTALWSAYGLAIGDKFVWGPNCVGLGFGVVQLLLKVMFPGS